MVPPYSGAKQRSPEMPKRSTTACHRVGETVVTQKRTRRLATDDPTSSGKTGNQGSKLRHRQSSDNRHRSSLGQHPGNQNRSTKKSSLELKGKILGPPDVEQSLSKCTGRSCETDDATSASSIEQSVLYSGSNDGSASSSSNHDDKIAFLESACAELSISVVCESESGLQQDPKSSLSENSVEDSKKVRSGPIFPSEVILVVLGYVEWRTVMQLLCELGQDCRESIYQPAFLRSRPSAEAEFSPSFFTTDAEGDLHWSGFNIRSRKWERLPSLNFAKKSVLPSPHPDLFIDYLVAGEGGIMCMNVGKSTGREELVVFNPLTRQVKVLPPLRHPRHPVLMHFKADADSGHYKIVVAGSAAIGTEDLSRKTEEYDSRTGQWECPLDSDMPCSPFGLNEYQNGAYFTDSVRELLLCVAIIGTRGRGVLAYDLKTRTWIQGLARFQIPLVRSEANVGHLATTQIVECGGNVYVFSEQECGKEVFFFIHKLNLDGHEEQPWDEVLRRKRAGGRGLLVYPEFTCAVVSEHELCIFNTVEHTIELIDLNNPAEVAPLLPAPSSKANRFHSLNPIGFVYRPSFKHVVCPRGRHSAHLCEYYKPGKYCSECERRDPQSRRHKKNMAPKNVGTQADGFPAPLGGMNVTKPPPGQARIRIRNTGRDQSVDTPRRNSQIPAVVSQM